MEEPEYATPAALVADRVKHNEFDVVIPGVGRVRVRALSRGEIIQAKRIDDTLMWERFVLSRAMINPRMSEAQVGGWQDASKLDEINEVAKVVNKLSGITQGADKSGVPDDGDQRGD